MIYVIFVLQIICILACGFGIYIEFTMHADIGYILITAGSFLFAISTKVTKVKLLKMFTELIKQSNTHKND